MKTIAQELIESQEALAKASVELEAANKVTLDMASERDALAAQVKTLTDEKDSLVATHKSALDEVSGKLTAEVTAHAETGKTLAEANKKLANPAYRMASAPGDKQGAEEGGQPSSEPEKTEAEAQAEYRKLDGKPEEQKAYRIKYWNVLGIQEEK